MWHEALGEMEKGVFKGRKVDSRGARHGISEARSMLCMDIVRLWCEDERNRILLNFRNDPKTFLAGEFFVTGFGGVIIVGMKARRG